MDKDNEHRYEEDADVTGEELSEAEMVKRLEEKLKKVRDDLSAARKEKQEYLDGWQRARAELLNSKKRIEEERLEFARFANAAVLRDLTQVIDSFEIAFSQKDAWEKIDESWRKGIESIYQQFLKILQQHGAERFMPEAGSIFKPEEQEPVATLETNDAKLDNTVVKAVSPGYRLHGKIIRPAKVQVHHMSDRNITS